MHVSSITSALDVRSQLMVVRSWQVLRIAGATSAPTLSTEARMASVLMLGHIPMDRVSAMLAHRQIGGAPTLIGGAMVVDESGGCQVQLLTVARLALELSRAAVIHRSVTGTTVSGGSHTSVLWGAWNAGTDGGHVAVRPSGGPNDSRQGGAPGFGSFLPSGMNGGHGGGGPPETGPLAPRGGRGFGIGRGRGLKGALLLVLVEHYARRFNCKHGRA